MLSVCIYEWFYSKLCYFFICFILCKKLVYYLPTIAGRVFINGPGNVGLIPGRVIPATQNTVLDTFLINTHYYKVLSRAKWSNPEEK